MKRKNNYKIITAVILFLAVPFYALSQEDSAKNELTLSLGYYMNNNKAMYLMANAKTKIDGKFQQVKGVVINVYLGAASDSNLISKVTTDKYGLAKAVIPATFKTVWEAAPTHTFLAISETDKKFESKTAEAAITKSKITIDTLNDGTSRSISVAVTSFNGTAWMPVPDVEMKIGIRRSLGGIISAGDEETYTTDSSGTAIAALTRDSLPGDEKGNIVLIAKVDENEQLGNLLVEQTVPWGIAVSPDNGFFDQRTLWSTRFRTPFWLLFMAYSIVIGVWGTIIYLILQIIKIKKIGVAVSSNDTPEMLVE
jgi:hypothetical protein